MNEKRWILSNLYLTIINPCFPTFQMKRKKKPDKPIIHSFLISRKEKFFPTEGDQNDTSAKTAYFQSHGKRRRGREKERGGENFNKGVTLITVKYVSQ